MKKTLLILTCILSFATAHAAQVADAFHGILPVTDPQMRRSLNGVWNVKVEKGITVCAEGLSPQPIPALDDEWSKIPVPGCWEAYGLCEPRYDKPDPLTGYYRTTFTVPEEWKGLRIILRFDGVLYGYDLWVNDRYVDSWWSGYNTALFDITPYLNTNKRENKPQQLALRVISQFPGSDFDYNDDWAPNGIFRDVTLMAVPDTHLEDLTIHPHNNGDVTVETKIANASRQTHVTHEIYDAQGRLVGSDHVDHPHLWTAETPYLYTLRTQLMHKGRVLQTFTHRFGFRELTIDGNILKLNGRPVKLRGVTCHATDPKTVKVVDEALTLKDMRLMKSASVNYIRTSHYPREPRFYELADSLGFYVIDEVPFGYGDKHLSDSTFYPILQQRAQATIRRDKNHASVLIWSLGNENPLTDICIRLGEYVKSQLDPSRPICYPQVGSYFRKFNYQFPSVADVYAPHYPTTSQIADFYQRADRPVIFTEYCHTLGISLEDHDRQWEIIERTPWIAGGSVWEWVDQGMPFRERLTDRYGYEERVFTSEEGGFEMYGNKGTDGLLYADRTPLPNYYELQHNYAQASVTDSVITTDDSNLTLHIRNRYDFVNLKDHVTFHWHLSADRDTIARGAFSPDCAARSATTYTLASPSAPVAGKINLLSLEITDRHGLTINRQTIRINPDVITRRLIEGLDVADTRPFIRDSMLVRVGRKATMCEKLRVADKHVERYLRRLPAMNAHIQTAPAGNATHVSFTLDGDTTDTFLSELGIAILLDKEIDRVQWIGNGVMPTYPGRYRAGQYGFWSLRQDDLYFEGNRRGVDAALLTNESGDGILLFCENGHVSFEQTDQGIILTYNAAVSGQGPKFARTAFPVISKEVGTVRGDFYLYHVDGRHLPRVIKELFEDPRTIAPAFHPFEKQYDTYLMRLEDILE